ncbi:unnamed protein product [Rotaria magnacalcarata]
MASEDIVKRFSITTAILLKSRKTSQMVTSILFPGFDAYNYSTMSCIVFLPLPVHSSSFPYHKYSIRIYL